MIPEPALFLAAHGWQDAEVTPFPADWSTRSYARLRRAGGRPERAILMHTTPDADFHSFIRIAAMLRGLEASAPLIYEIDAERGMMLLEDFGDRNFGRLIDNGADQESLLCRAATTLAELHTRYIAQPRDATTLRRYDSSAFIELLHPLLHNFTYTDHAAAQTAFHEAWSCLRTPLEAQPQSLMLRDFMADNLMDLPERHGWKSVGILDFELTGIGPAAYDLASLTEQVRRDIPDAVRTRVIQQYLGMRPDIAPEPFHTALRIMAAHRHLRIFARLQKLPKPFFLRRTHDYLRTLFTHPDLHPVQKWCQTYLPQHFA